MRLQKLVVTSSNTVELQKRRCRRLDDDAYGRAILNEVSARLERDVAAGAVQATLDRLERKGLVRSKLGSGTAIRDGRARRFHAVLAEGLRALNDAKAAHDSIWHGFPLPLKGQRAKG
jgi:DNA-binding PadR family transcriptional regulator